ncbi:MAG TPA: Crp/Fnr family transcriptional regulator [Myxococcales bacterium]|nr:Crp/Fnr family transcriptional regulator [Myxococcales bacterium]
MPQSTKLDPRQLLAGVPLFSQLPAPQLAEVAALTSTRLFAARELVFREGAAGDAAYTICYGTLKASAQAPDGRELLLSIMGPGETFGELAILDGAPRSATVSAVEPSLLLVLERARFQSLVERNAAISYRMLLAMAARLRRLTGRMEDAAFLDVPGRLVKRLLELAGGRAPDADGWVALGSRLSQRELGELIGATRESVNKAPARAHRSRRRRAAAWPSADRARSAAKNQRESGWFAGMTEWCEAFHKAEPASRG